MICIFYLDFQILLPHIMQQVVKMDEGGAKHKVELSRSVAQVSKGHTFKIYTFVGDLFCADAEPILKHIQNTLRT